VTFEEHIMSLFDQVNTAENSNEAVTNEKHIPIVKIDDIGDNKHKVTVDVGGGKHPNEIDHWIQFVELRVNGLYVGRAEFAANITDPVAEFIVNCKGTCGITAVARCNKHGLWESTPVSC
jgi:superoxide reductase